ncbi:universal stress protein [Chitinophaga vietnamensis]|uniref:universal stress protein n=1 Tax=Chitinophaga vietnamensis TaxID=2593957 RepID=UPI00117807DB|nr:universal stress protein [Chitinophaga vietnamensis]
MKKILLVADSMLLTKGAMKYACYIANMTGSRLTGVFVENEPSPDIPALTHAPGQPYVKGKDHKPVRTMEQLRNVDSSIHEFLMGCEKEGTTATVFRGSAVTPDEVIEEAKLSDLLIADATTSLAEEEEPVPSRFIRHLLAGATCPVLITPPVFEAVEEVVFCYDHSDAAIHAMKQFSLLLPVFSECRATVLTVNKEGVILPEEKRRLREWLCKYYDNAEFKVLEGDPDTQLFTYLMKSKRTLVVMGAYGRSVVSRFFHQSHADLLMRSLAFPVFIAHT